MQKKNYYNSNNKQLGPYFTSHYCIVFGYHLLISVYDRSLRLPDNIVYFIINMLFTQDHPLNAFHTFSQYYTTSLSKFYRRHLVFEFHIRCQTNIVNN